MGEQRDTQKQRLYRAERLCSWWKMGKGAQLDFASTKEVHRYIERLRRSKWAARNFKRFVMWGPVEVRAAGRTWAHGGTHHIELCPGAFTHAVVLHELAHTITRRCHGTVVAGHGREYAAVYLKLVRHQLGIAAWKELKASMRSHGVRYTPKRKMTPEQRAKLQESGRRLAALRAAACTTGTQPSSDS